MAETPTDRSTSADKPRWRQPGPSWIGIGLFIYGSVFVLSQAKDFLVPVVLAFLLAMVFSPIRRCLDRRGIPAGLSSFLIVLALIIGFLGIAGALAVPVTNWVQNAPKIERQIQNRIASVSRSMNGLIEANARMQELTEPSKKDGSKQPVQVTPAGGGVVMKLAMLAPSVIAQFIFTFVLLLFLLASGDMFYEKVVHVLPTWGDKRRAMRIAFSIERKLSRYLMTITIINFCLGIAVGVMTWAYGMPSPVVFGVIAFVFNFIPYLGALGGILIAAAVAVVSFDWIGWAPVIAVTYLAMTTLEGQIITPYFVGRNLRLNTVVVFIAVSFWAWLWSAVGMIVAVPLLIAIKTFCENIDTLEHLGDFLSERHAELAADGDTVAAPRPDPVD